VARNQRHGFGPLKSVTGLGLVGDVFGDPACLTKLPGESSIGHVRYSTAITAAKLAAQRSAVPGGLPVRAGGQRQPGELPSAAQPAQGSIFNTSSDMEVILHLIATSLSHLLLSRICDAYERLAGVCTRCCSSQPTSSSLCTNHLDSGPWSWVAAPTAPWCSRRRHACCHLYEQ
jgi:glutamine phosphoribosylpyrophosphate amidotransferase